MKKIICLTLAACILVLSLCSCSAGTTNGNSVPTATDDQTTAPENLPDYVGKTPAEYDSDGNFLLTSTDDRVVYTYSEGGYVVFTFAGEAVSKIQRVLEFASAAEAQEYTAEKTLEAVNNGEVPPQMLINGSNVIEEVGLSTDSNSLGSYYAKSKSAVLADFPSESKVG